MIGSDWACIKLRVYQLDQAGESYLLPREFFFLRFLLHRGSTQLRGLRPTTSLGEIACARSLVLLSSTQNSKTSTNKFIAGRGIARDKNGGRGSQPLILVLVVFCGLGLGARSSRACGFRASKFLVQGKKPRWL